MPSPSPVSKGLSDETLREHYERVVDRLTRLQSLTAALAGARTAAGIGEIIVRQGLSSLQADIGVVAILQPDRRTLVNVEFEGVSAETQASWASYPVDSPVPVAEAARRGEPVLVHTREERNLRYPALAAVHGEDHGGAVAALPLLVNGSVVGSIGFCFPQSRAFDEEERSYLVAIAQQCALAVERVQLLERVQHEAEQRRRSEETLREESRVTETLHTISTRLSAELDLEKLVQTLTDEGTRLAEAEFGAFFYNVISADGQSYMLYTLSGVPRAAFAGFPMPRNTAVFAPTFGGEGILRIDDITADPRYGRSGPHFGMPKGHLPVRSYLAVPVKSRSGEVLGGLFFGHARVGMFSARHEKLLESVASHAAIAIDNARLYQSAQESKERLTLALAASRLGDWSWNAQTDVVTLSAHAAAALDLPPDLPTTWSGMLELVHPDDRERARAAVERAVAEDGQYEIEYRIRRPDGPLVWMSALGRATYGGDGKATGMYGVIGDVTQRKVMEQELRERAEALVEADRRKDDFLAMLAHELRNPLGPIRNGVHLLRQVLPANERVERIRAIIDRQTTHMTRIVDDLLDVSRITRGKIDLQKTTIDLVQLAREVTDDFRGDFENAKVGLALEEGAGPLWIVADRTRFAQCLGNLLHNALKFTNAGGHVEVALGVRGDSAVLRVRDDGIGIEPEVLKSLFEPFAQGHQALDRSRGGLGLGLAVVEGLLGLHGGTIVASSPGSGMGTSFTIQMALAGQHTSLAKDAAPSPGGQRRILIVEDNQDAAESLQLLLAMAGHTVEVAASGREALALAQRFAPETVICDIGLPELDGYEVCKAFKREASHAGCWFVALTGYGQEQDIRKAREAGFDVHLTKPVDPAELMRGLAGSWAR